MRTLWTVPWRATLLIGAVGTVAAAALTAVLGYRGGIGLKLEPTLSTDPAIEWTGVAETPAQLATRATDYFTEWLVVIGAAVALVGAISIGALWAQQAAVRAADLVILRAVGASRRRIARAALGEGFGALAAALLVGAVVALAAAAVANRGWSGEPPSWRLSLVPATFAIGGPILLGALLPLWSIRSLRVAETAEAPPPLRIPATQLGASLAVVVAGAALLRHADTGFRRPAAGLDPAATIHRVDSSAPTVERRSAGYEALLARIGDSGAIGSLTGPGGHLGAGTVDHLVTDCGQCYVGGIYLRYRNLRATYHTTSADTFTARGLTVVQGRAFASQDDLGGPPVAIVNIYLARRYFEDGNPIGRDLFLGGRMSRPHRVIGVVDDGLPDGYGAGLRPLESLYLSILQHPSATGELLVERRSRPPESDPTIVIGPPRTVAATVAAAAAPARWFGGWFAGLGLAGVALALIGTMSLMIIWVGRLRPEVAIRRAVGARRLAIVLLVVGQALRTGLLGIAICLTFFAPALWPELGRFAAGVSAWDFGLVARSAALLVAGAVIAALVPAWKASRASPAEVWSAR
jgi:putative ABC transport system permease protein